MTRTEARTRRLYVTDSLSSGAAITVDKPQAHYLCNVLRLTEGDPVLLFNGRDGEWRSTITTATKREVRLTPQDVTREQTPSPNLHYWFAPLKHERLDYLVQKAVEMGVSRLQPVITQRTQSTRLNLDRMRANAVEAAEQCELLSIPEMGEPVDLNRAIAGRQAGRLLVFCDEEANIANPAEALLPFRSKQSEGSALLPSGVEPSQTTPMAVLVGPEGGFTDEERAMLINLEHSVRLSLGPRILRADTAAVAALAVVQAVLGDWR